MPLLKRAISAASRHVESLQLEGWANQDDFGLTAHDHSGGDCCDPWTWGRGSARLGRRAWWN